jgi:hypothetical protein
MKVSFTVEEPERFEDSLTSSKSLSVPEIFVVETELMPPQKRQVFLFTSL